MDWSIFKGFVLFSGCCFFFSFFLSLFLSFFVSFFFHIKAPFCDLNMFYKLLLMVKPSCSARLKRELDTKCHFADLSHQSSWQASQYNNKLLKSEVLLVLTKQICKAAVHRTNLDKFGISLEDAQTSIMWLNISKGTSCWNTGFWVMVMQSQNISKYSPKVDVEISHILESLILLSYL